MKLTHALSLLAMLAGATAGVDAAPAAAAAAAAVRDGLVADLDLAQPVYRRGRGGDDGPNHDAGDDRGRGGKKGGRGRGRAADDGRNHTWLPALEEQHLARRGRGGDDAPGDDRGGHGSDDGADHA